MKLYNTLTHKLEEFIPLNTKKVKIYVCGITPYDTTHLGHAFTYVFFDVLNRYLRSKEYDVFYTQNVTDINDRDNDILKRANEQGIPWKNLAKYWTDKFLADMHELNWIKPDNYLWASETIPQIVNIVEKLIKNNKAYTANGGVYLDISEVKKFGKLSGLSREKMLLVAKEFEEDIDNSDKKNQLDITLWRPTESTQPAHIPSFNSPFGPGRPGWHIECSAMAISSLGEQIDIHGGGMDLIYPHHESEVAQSEGATNLEPFAKYWIHTNVVSYQGRKMSKSIGNLVMISDLLKKYSPNAIRYVMLSHHYRTAWEFKEQELIEAEKKITIIQIASKNKSENDYLGADKTYEDFKKQLDDDMNTPKALEILLNAENAEKIKLMTSILGFKFK